MRRLLIALLILSTIEYTLPLQARYSYCKRIAAYIALSLLFNRVASKEHAEKISKLIEVICVVDSTRLFFPELLEAQK